MAFWRYLSRKLNIGGVGLIAGMGFWRLKTLWVNIRPNAWEGPHTSRWINHIVRRSIHWRGLLMMTKALLSTIINESKKQRQKNRPPLFFRSKMVSIADCWSEQELTKQSTDKQHWQWRAVIDQLKKHCNCNQPMGKEPHIPPTTPLAFPTKEFFRRCSLK